MTIKKEELGSVYKIRINDKEIKEHLRVAVDRVLLLHGNQGLWTQFNRTLDNFMIKYWELPEEEMTRVLPEVVKYNQKKFKNKMAKQGKNYASYQGHPRKPMFINDPDDDSKTVIPITMLEGAIKTEIAFKYKTIKEIMKDKNLSTKEKIAMTERYMELKTNIVSNKPKIAEIKSVDYDVSDDDLDDILEGLTMGDEIYTPKQLEESGLTLDDIEFLDDVEEVEIIDVSKKTPKEMFATLCQIYPKKFAMTKKSGHVGWHRYKKVNDEKVQYTPILITNDPKEWQTAKEKYLMDSTTNYLSDAYFVRESKTSGFYMYFIRTT